MFPKCGIPKYPTVIFAFNFYNFCSIYIAPQHFGKGCFKNRKSEFSSFKFRSKDERL